MDHWSTGDADLPSFVGRGNADRGSDHHACAAFGFVDLPESLEVLADHFGARIQGWKQTTGNAERGDQIDGVAANRIRLFEERVAIEPPRVERSPGNDAPEQDIDT